MAERDALTVQRLRAVIHYDPEAGVFVRRSSRRRTFEGRRAGHMHKDGYLRIVVDGHLYRAHRLAFLYMTGAWPEKHIDHMNRNTADNRWSNLREATRSQNIANSRVRRDNTSGAKGVSLHRQTGKWAADVYKDHSRYHLGLFATVEEAASARNELATKLYGQVA